jgi:branched-chain amino acid transport system ATP-binding protein
MIAGYLMPTRGKIILKGEDITKLPPYRRTGRGISRVFQRNELFRSFTVRKNLLIAFHRHSKKSVVEILVKTNAGRTREEIEHKKATEILEFVGLAQQADEMATNLPHGSQRALCLAIAVATEPGLLLLDEPLTGMNAEETANMMKMIRALRDERGITSIVVEHNMRAVINLCDRAVVLDYGKKVCEGSPTEVVEDPRVIEAYLGMGQDAV